MSAASALATRRSRQDSTAIRSTNEYSSSPTGLRSDTSHVWKLSKSASSSASTTSEAAVSPCHNELRAALALPAGVIGPVLFCAFNRFAANCAGLVMLPCSSFRNVGITDHNAFYVQCQARRLILWEQVACSRGRRPFAPRSRWHPEAKRHPCPV